MVRPLPRDSVTALASTEILIGGSNQASTVLSSPNCHSKTAAAICSRAAAAGWTSKTSTCLLPFSSMLSTRLLATLLVHAQYQGYWSQLGMQFQEEMEALLERHILNGLIDAPWVRTDDPESDDDDGFFAALQELVAYAFEESVRIKKTGRLFPGWHEIPARSSHGILQEVQSLLQKYRSELVRQSRLLDQAGRA
jgi:hypothetical protein